MYFCTCNIQWHHSLLWEKWVKADLASSWLSVSPAASLMAQMARSCSTPGPAATEPRVPLSHGGDAEWAGQGLAGHCVRALSPGKCIQAWHRQRQRLSTSTLPCCHSTLEAVVGPLLCHQAVALNAFFLWFLFSCPPPTTHFNEISEWKPGIVQASSSQHSESPGSKRAWCPGLSMSNDK